MNARRGFLASCIALASAPAIVRADSLMRIVPRKMLVCDLRFVSPTEWYLKEGQDCVKYFYAPADSEARVRALLMSSGIYGGVKCNT